MIGAISNMDFQKVQDGHFVVKTFEGKDKSVCRDGGRVMAISIETAYRAATEHKINYKFAN